MPLSLEKERELKLEAANVRMRTVQMIYHGKGGHIGGDLSEADLLVGIFNYMRHDPKNPDWEERDRFILSKGHSAEAFYAVLAEHGYLEQSVLDTFGSFDSPLGGHPNKKIRGVEANTGSLGHGLGLAVGTALALKRDGKLNRIFVLTGDGELAEGSNWEAAMSAAKFQLGNLTWIVDRNHLQISGSTEEVMPLEDLKKKAEAFGFQVKVIDGHNFQEILEALDYTEAGKPICVIANTIKGKGLACAENQASWHHKVPTEEQLEMMEEAYNKEREELR